MGNRRAEYRRAERARARAARSPSPKKVSRRRRKKRHTHGIKMGKASRSVRRSGATRFANPFSDPKWGIDFLRGQGF